MDYLCITWMLTWVGGKVGVSLCAEGAGVTPAMIDVRYDNGEVIPSSLKKNENLIRCFRPTCLFVTSKVFRLRHPAGG